MIGKGDAAIPSAMAAISGVTPQFPCSLLVPSDRRAVEFSRRVAGPQLPVAADGKTASGARCESAMTLCAAGA